MKKEETLLKSDVRKKLVSGIDLWLNCAKESNEKAGQYSIGSSRWDSYGNDAIKYEGMAQAVFFVGQHLGLLTYDDYPVFGPSDELPADTNEEGQGL